LPSPTDPTSYLATTAGTPFHALTAHGPWGAAPGAVLVVAMVVARGAGEAAEGGGAGARARSNGTSRFTLLATTSPQVTSPSHRDQPVPWPGQMPFVDTLVADDILSIAHAALLSPCVLCV